MVTMEEQNGVGVPDALQRLWTPHRMAYIQGENKPDSPDPGDGCPFCRIQKLSDEDALIVEVATFTKAAMTAVRTAAHPQGFNIGLNQGDAAGAGIAAHLHQHIVPRWFGDSNFMPVIGHTRTLPQLLTDTRRLLAEAWVAG